MKGHTMSRTVLEYDAAHEFVTKQSKAGNDVRWEGWDMVFFKPTPYGFSNPKGAFRKGRWGMENRVTPDSTGRWVVPVKNVKPLR
jgi:hypothetical protein